jgi:hypothetical protein
MWVWVLIGVGSFLGLSLLVGVALGRVLGQISELLYEPEDWSTMPITRDVDEHPSSPADAEMGRTAWATSAEAGPSNVDMLAWFSEGERQVCGSCGEKTCVGLPDVFASFCLACGAVWADGVRIDASPASPTSRPVNAS